MNLCVNEIGYHSPGGEHMHARVHAHTHTHTHNISRHSRVSAAKKDVRHTSVLFTGTAKSWPPPHSYLYKYYTGFYEIYVFYVLYIHDLTYQI